LNLYNSPADGARIGGDWCAAFMLPDRTVALTIGDVTGHGELAADTMAVLRSAIVSAMRDHQSPVAVLSMANAIAFDRGSIVTALVALLDRQRGTLTIANAGHPPPLIVTTDRHRFVQYGVGDFPLGIFPKHYTIEHTAVVSPDAMIVLYTDGFTENTRDLLHDERWFVDASRAAYDRPADDAADAIAQHVFRNGRGHDDAAMVVAHASPSTRWKRRGARRSEQTFASLNATLV
jgi:serine phosphatase RsbU (regulator of sigma subunit)